ECSRGRISVTWQTLIKPRPHLSLDRSAKWTHVRTHESGHTVAVATDAGETVFRGSAPALVRTRQTRVGPVGCSERTRHLERHRQPVALRGAPPERGVGSSHRVGPCNSGSNFRRAANAGV